MAISVWKTKKGEKRFQVKVRDQSGNWLRSRSFELLEDAMKEEAELLKLKRKGVRAISDDAKSVTFDEYWSVWSIENRTETSEGWKISQDQMNRDYISPVIGRLALAKVGMPEIGRILNRVKEMGRADQTRKHVYSLLRQMFADAVEYYEMLGESPVKARFHRPKVANRKREFLKPDEAWHLLEFVADHFTGPAIWLQTLAGLRKEAVIGLSWDCVDWDLNQILIRRAWKQKVGRLEDYPKGKDWEYVPMNPSLKDYLWGKWLACQDPEAFVCQGPSGGQLSYDTYDGALKRICGKAGVKRVSTHELRHSCTEIWVQAGASQEDIRRLLNHKSDSATQRYIHRTGGRLEALALKIERPALRLIQNVPGNVPVLEQRGGSAPQKKGAING